MKILFINETKENIGGAEKVVYSTIKLLNSKGNRTKLLATADVYQTIKSFFRSFFSINYFIKTLKLIEEFKPDVVHVHGASRFISPSPILAAKIKRKKVVMTVHDFIYYCPRGWGINWLGKVCNCGFSLNCFFRNCRSPRMGLKNAIFNLLKAVKIFFHRELLKRKVDYFICPSRKLKELMEKNLNIPREKITYLPNFIEINKNKKINFNRIKENQFLYVGRISKEKGVETAIKAMNILVKRNNLRDVKLKIIGDGPERGDLERLTQELNLLKNIKFLGRVPNEKISQYYQESLAVVMPSIWMENCPIVALEAMLNSKPIIASNIGGFPDLIEHHKNGFLFEPGNYKEMSRYIKALYNNTKLSKKMGEYGYRKLKEEFSRERYYRNLKKIYDKV